MTKNANNTKRKVEFTCLREVSGFRFKTKMKIGLSAACDFQLFLRTWLIYGNETCFEFLSLSFGNSHCF